MSPETLQEILQHVQQPSRYLGNEINSVHKKSGRSRLHVALAFPDLYEIGTSHFGLQILYHILNRRGDIAAERVFTPAVDMERMLRSRSARLCSLESRTALNRFDLIGFSLLYELDYTNVLTMLDLGGVPFLSRERGPGDPLVIAGGPCTCNPEPMADFFDAMVIGDGESVLLDMAVEMAAWKDRDGDRRLDLLESWSKIEGVYIPSFFEPSYDSGGRQVLRPQRSNYRRIRRAVVTDLDATPFPDRPVIPFGRPIHDRLRLEVARGCTRGCRFCQAGMIYRPVRERAPENLLELARTSLAATGYEDLSLLSLSTGDYCAIDHLMARLIRRGRRQRFAVSLPSLRADTLSAGLMHQVRSLRKTGFTIAPEAGSQRLRDVINKNIDETDIVQTVQSAFESGWNLIKLYFMVGLPTESDDDRSAIIDVVRRLRSIARKSPGSRRKQINVSVATFVPKPHTPFQWEPQLSLSESNRVLKEMRARLHLPGIRMKWQNPEVSSLEGLWARGDRRLSKLLIAAWRSGCRLDGWSDHFDYRRWMEAVEECQIDVDAFTTRVRDTGEPLPWDHVDGRLSPEFLLDERRRAFEEKPSPDCRQGKCLQCGSCDFKTTGPVLHPRPAATASDVRDQAKADPERFYRRLTLWYSKQGPARFFGHLEMSNIFQRALRRADIEVEYSRGYHPKPKISFGDPLPVGVESDCEYLIVSSEVGIQHGRIVDRLNRQLTPGMKILACLPAGAEAAEGGPRIDTYRVRSGSELFDPARIEEFKIAGDWMMEKRSSKGRVRSVNLKEKVVDMQVAKDQALRLELRAGPQGGVRAAEAVRRVFGLDDRAVKALRIRKTATRPDPKTGVPNLSP